MGILVTYRAIGTRCARGDNFPARGSLSYPQSSLRSQGHQNSAPGSLQPPTRAPVIYSLCTHLLPLIESPILLSSSVALCWLSMVCPPSAACPSSESQGLLQDGEATGSLGIFGRVDQGRQQEIEGDAWATLVSHPSSF